MVPKLKLAQPVLQIFFNWGSYLGCLNGSYAPELKFILELHQADLYPED